MTSTSASLSSIETELARLHRRVVTALRPGLTTTEVRAQLAMDGLEPAEDVASLYCWHDGSDTSTGLGLDDLHLVPGFYLLSLEDALTSYRALRVDARWRVGWLPVLANGGGDFLICDLSETAVTPVRHFRIEESEHPVEYGSLGAMFETFAAAFQAGFFYIDANGFLEIDDESYSALAASLNPAVSWWTD